MREHIFEESTEEILNKTPSRESKSVLELDENVYSFDGVRTDINAEIQNVQSYVVEEKTDYFDGYFEVGVIFSLGVLIGVTMGMLLVRIWHT